MRDVYYKLIGKEAVPASMDELADIYESNRVVKQEKVNGVKISTVFLVLDHAFHFDDPPLIFETMIFGGEHDMYQDRYTTWEEAERGHQRAVDIVKGLIDSESSA
jgi:hypothetical protein